MFFMFFSSGALAGRREVRGRVGDDLDSGSFLLTTGLSFFIALTCRCFRFIDYVFGWLVVQHCIDPFSHTVVEVEKMFPIQQLYGCHLSIIFFSSVCMKTSLGVLVAS